MSLSKYKEKRSFNATPEPEGQEHEGQGELRFVIQKHQASHLHYDFRLEMEGVLKSWAVPKGPSMRPEDKRLAMMVEDHPYEYRTFEGIIPKGNYGAGTVIIWDEGTYVPADLPKSTRTEQHKALLSALHKGNLKFILKGKKLKGEFVLVKSHRADMENGWLLIKTSDKYASDDDITLKDKSVVSKKNLEQVAATSTKEWQSNRDASGKNKKPAHKKARAQNVSENTFEWKEELTKKGEKKPFPEQLSPMLATLTDKAFDKAGWIYEIKWDGYRAVGYVKKGKAELLSRNQLSYSSKFKPIAESLKEIPLDLVLDGEIVAINEHEQVSFQQLQQWQKTGKGMLVYYVFDLLWIEGYSIMHWPLTARKKLLQQVLPDDPHIQYSDHIEERGTEFFDLASDQGLEGIMAKDGNSEYIKGARTTNWLKIKTSMRQEAVITGFTEGRGSRKHFGALVLGIYDKGKLEYIGHTGSGFDESALGMIYQKLESLVTDTCPFEKVPKTKMPVTWVKPKLVCEVKFQEWTRDNSMRHPIFMGLRSDKKPTEVTREQQLPVTAVVKKPKKTAVRTSSTSKVKRKRSNS
ncbi:MAG TPA: non-homologous end-joining DNA ligase [Flavitalea sp.]|nr:non-homologous end-joining DNA ligase [Flavitalea sp.]